MPLFFLPLKKPATNFYLLPVSMKKEKVPYFLRLCFLMKS
jgi:hypothetical protein